MIDPDGIEWNTQQIALEPAANVCIRIRIHSTFENFIYPQFVRCTVSIRFPAVSCRTKCSAIFLFLSFFDDLWCAFVCAAWVVEKIAKDNRYINIYVRDGPSEFLIFFVFAEWLYEFVRPIHILRTEAHTATHALIHIINTLLSGSVFGLVRCWSV